MPPVIHRDLKSANILLDRNMRAKVNMYEYNRTHLFLFFVFDAIFTVMNATKESCYDLENRFS